MRKHTLLTGVTEIQRFKIDSCPPHQERGKLRRNDRETGPIEFGMKNLGLRIYVLGGKYKGIEAQGIRVQGCKSKRHKSIRV